MWPDVSFIFVDLMWSDPDEVETWAVSPRGAGWLFGASVTNEVRHYFLSPWAMGFSPTAHFGIRSVQSCQFFDSNSTRTPTCPGGLQIYVLRHLGDGVVRA
jgi:hypothetical protein